MDRRDNIAEKYGLKRVISAITGQPFECWSDKEMRFDLRVNLRDGGYRLYANNIADLSWMYEMEKIQDFEEACRLFAYMKEKYSKEDIV